MRIFGLAFGEIIQRDIHITAFSRANKW